MAYTLPVLLYALLWPMYLVLGAARRGPWWMGILQPLAPWVFLPAMLLLPLGLVTASSPLALWGALFIWLWFWRFARSARRLQEPAPMGGAIKLTVMTCNLLKSNCDTAQVAETIATLDPDVVALQELRAHHAEVLLRMLGATYRYHDLRADDDFRGMGLLSKHPLEQVTVIAGDPDTSPTQVAQISVAQRQIWIVNVHPRIPMLSHLDLLGWPLPYGLDSQERRQDIADIVAATETLLGDVIILGDLNATDQCYEFALFDSQWSSAFHRAGRGLGLTYPVGAKFFGLRLLFPLFGIDHILYRGGLTPLDAQTGNIPGSDHRYLMAKLVLKDGADEMPGSLGSVSKLDNLAYSADNIQNDE